MAILNVSPTRMELTINRNRFAVAVKGHQLLKEKRDELMRLFLEMMRETRELRGRVEERLAAVSRGISFANSVMTREATITALMMPKQKISPEVSTKNIIGVEVPVFSIRQGVRERGDALSYGYALTSGDLDEAIMTLSDALPDLIRLAQQEKAVQLLAAEIEKTRRRVNALEYVIIPNYKDTIRFILMKLDENERGNLTRLMKVKDIMVKKELESRKSRKL